MASGAGTPWTDEENDAIVADYFAMLADDLAGRRPNKAEHNRQLRTRIDRSRASIEFKHRNISAVLKAFAQTWLYGYRPAYNFQDSLIDAVWRWLERNPDLFAPSQDARTPTGVRDPGSHVSPPPTHSNAPPPADARRRAEIRYSGPGPRFFDAVWRWLERNPDLDSRDARATTGIRVRSMSRRRPRIVTRLHRPISRECSASRGDSM